MTTDTTDLKITRIRITDYRGITAIDEVIPPSGKIARGRSASGKTSFLRAFQAALGANDIKPDAVRNGASKAEIIVDLGELSVRRAISRSSARSTLEVTKDGGKAKLSAPQSVIGDLIGNAAVDPLELMLAKPAERKAQILAALPVEVSEARLRTWAPTLPVGFSCDGHGLDVVARAHKHFYDQRHAANATARAKQVEAERLAGDVKPVLIALPIERAREGLATAQADLASLESQQRHAAEQEDRLASSRQKVESLRKRADETEALEASYRVGADELQRAAEENERLGRELDAAKEALRLAQQNFERSTNRIASMRGNEAKADGLRTDAASYRQTADELESALVGSVPTVDAARIATARETVESAKHAIAQAEESARRETARAAAEAAAQEAKQAADAAGELDAIVKRLVEAPAELIEESKGIPGLTIEGDDIALDGVALNRLCGFEQMKFCIDIAKRLCAKSKILIVDGLERIDEDTRREFLQEVTRDGWQLIGTLVDRGDMALVAVESLAGAAAAAE